MLGGKVTINRIKSSRVEITLTAFITNFRLYVLNDVKVVFKPMLAFYFFLDRVTTAKLANHTDYEALASAPRLGMYIMREQFSQTMISSPFFTFTWTCGRR